MMESGRWSLPISLNLKLLCSYVHESQVTAAAGNEDLQEVANDEFLGNALIIAGWLKPLTILNRNHAMQTLIVHDVLKKMARATGSVP